MNRPVGGAIAEQPAPTRPPAHHPAWPFVAIAIVAVALVAALMFRRRRRRRTAI